MVMRLLGLRSEPFRHALRGLRDMLRRERHARFHALATVAVVIAGLVLDIDRRDWIALFLAIALVFGLEAMNTAIEALCDVVSPERDERVRLAKDVAAGGVLVAAVASLGVAALVFGRRILAILVS